MYYVILKQRSGWMMSPCFMPAKVNTNTADGVFFFLFVNRPMPEYMFIFTFTYICERVCLQYLFLCLRVFRASGITDSPGKLTASGDLGWRSADLQYTKLWATVCFAAWYESCRPLQSTGAIHILYMYILYYTVSCIVCNAYCTTTMYPTGTQQHNVEIYYTSMYRCRHVLVRRRAVNSNTKNLNSNHNYNLPLISEWNNN